MGGFRAVLGQQNWTQKGRAQSDPTASICPIEEPAELDARVANSRQVGGPAHIVDLSAWMRAYGSAKPQPSGGKIARLDRT